MISVRTWIVIGAFALGGAVGGGVVRYAWQAADLAAAKEQAEQMANLADQLRKMNDEKDQALSERDSALADLRVRNLDNARLSERLRKQSASAVPNTPSGTCQPVPCQTLPQALVSDTSQNAATFSQKVRDFLQKAVNWSESLTQTEPQSGN